MLLHCSVVAAEAVPVIVVGGGAGLCGDVLDGASRIIKPQHGNVANAVGAAIPQVSFIFTQHLYCISFLFM